MSRPKTAHFQITLATSRKRTTLESRIRNGIAIHPSPLHRSYIAKLIHNMAHNESCVSAPTPNGLFTSVCAAKTARNARKQPAQRQCLEITMETSLRNGTSITAAMETSPLDNRLRSIAIKTGPLSRRLLSILMGSSPLDAYCGRLIIMATKKAGL